MSCCNSGHCSTADRIFDADYAQDDLDDYHTHGPERETTMLIEALRGEARRFSADGLTGMTLLDIGGGVGPLHHELLKAGVSRAVDVDASAAFIEASKQEAARLGHTDRIEHKFGDFVDLAASVQSADIVTLDRVICCYPDMRALVRLSADRAEKLYGLVFPRDGWWMKVGAGVANVWERITRGLPFWIHDGRAVDALLREAGLTRAAHLKTNIWQVMVYRARLPGD